MFRLSIGIGLLHSFWTSRYRYRPIVAKSPIGRSLVTIGYKVQHIRPSLSCLAISIILVILPPINGGLISDMHCIIRTSRFPVFFPLPLRLSFPRPFGWLPPPYRESQRTGHVFLVVINVSNRLTFLTQTFKECFIQIPYFNHSIKLLPTLFSNRDMCSLEGLFTCSERVRQHPRRPRRRRHTTTYAQRAYVISFVRQLFHMFSRSPSAYLWHCGAHSSYTPHLGAQQLSSEWVLVSSFLHYCD